MPLQIPYIHSGLSPLQVYYGNAIRRGNTVEEMRQSIMATLDHCTSTDLVPNHKHCPKGIKSWCFYQVAIADPKRYDPPNKLPSHADNIHTPLNPKVIQHLRPIYERLSQPDLLKRCLNHRTQNTNECLHSVIWSIVPKDLFLHYHRVIFGVSTAVMQFNKGMQSSQQQIIQVGLSPGQLSKNIQKSKDSLRKVRSTKKDKAKVEKRCEMQRDADTASRAVNLRHAPAKQQPAMVKLQYGAGKY
jgi:hypothetical protein